MRREEDLDERTPTLPTRETSVTVRAQSDMPSQELETVQWDSQNLISASTEHLYGLMIELEKSESSVMTAVEVAKGIQSLMRLQLDAWKAINGNKK